MSETATPNLAQVMHSIIQRIATGPELSKNISQEEARMGMQGILEGGVDPVQAAIFFIALRMKRETAEENRGVLDAILAATQRVEAEVNEVVDIADPYDGYNRCLPVAPFLGPLLAEFDLHGVSHSADAIGPKYGVTARHVLAAAGVPVDLSPQQAAQRLGDPAIGWSYIDQAAFCPQLAALIPLRRRVVKRQVLTTVEVLAKPITGRKHTHFVTGYVHKPYPPVYAMLARHAGFDSALILRGVEGGVIPSLRQASKMHRYEALGDLMDAEIDPAAVGISQSVRSVPLPDDLPKSASGADEVAIMVDVAATAQMAAQVGAAALAGEKGPAYDALALTTGLILQHTGRATSLQAGVDAARAALDSGRALARLC
jgi:anthranilate phosphoribosyltransferase